MILCRSATFLITDASGEVSGSDQGFYHRDRRLLHRYRLTFAGKRPTALSGRALEADRAQFFLIAPPVAGIARGALVVERRLALSEGLLEEEIALRNYGQRASRVPLELRLGSDFSHIFGVKRRVLGQHGDGDQPVAELRPDGRSAFVLEAPDGRTDVRLRIAADIAPDALDAPAGRLHFVLDVPAEGSALLHLRFDARSPAVRSLKPSGPRPHLEAPPALRAFGDLGGPLTRAYDRSLRDLYALAIRGRTIGLTEGDDAVAYAAGIPWYIALFGRDALLTSHMALPYAPEFAAGSLRALARLQGTKLDRETAEAPGKILHEFRPLLVPDDHGVIPRFPYYGSVDATPLFLFALEEFGRITGRRDLTDELFQNAEAAIGWMDGAGDADGDGYLEYHRFGREGLRNQGWKDSWDAIHFRSKRLAQAPISLVEVQGYQYAARRAFARMLADRGEQRRAREQAARAEGLRDTFAHDFWMEERGYYALGLDRRKRQIDVRTSNGAQVLFTGIAQTEHALKVADAVFEAPFWSGYGIRTLAQGEGRYNPVSYHNGSVWPHDNALIAEGLMRIGRPDSAMRIAAALIRASLQRTDRRLPELYAGFSQDESPEPVPYPSACPVQAWSAAAIPHLVTLMLGLEVEDGEATLRPTLPDGIDRLEVDGLWVLGERISARIERNRSGAPTLRVDAPDGLRVRVRRSRR